MKLGIMIWPTNVYVMFKKALIPATKVVPATGTAYTVGSPPLSPVSGMIELGSGLYSYGWASIPAKMVASRTEMKVKNAEAVPNFDKALKVLGREQIQQISVAMTAKTIVHWLWLVMVLRYLALTRTCRPCSL
jgi:hypothetical protein